MSENVLICRETPVTYREDVALEDAWHEEAGTAGLNYTTTVSRLAQWYLRWLRLVNFCFGTPILFCLGFGLIYGLTKTLKVVTNQFFIVPLIYPDFLTFPHLQTILILTRFKLVWPQLSGSISFPIFFKRVFKAYFCRMSLFQCQ